MESEEKEDNLTKQIDEIEVLTSIYGEDWKVEDEASRRYCITLQQEGGSGFKLSLELTLPDEYPSGSPPIYTLNGPWLRGGSRLEIENALQEIYLDNIGECILYMWIERVREFLQDCQDPSADGGQSASDQLMAAWTEGDQSESRESDAAESNEVTVSDFIKKKPLENIPCPEIFHSEFLWDRKSKFQSHLAAVNKKEEIEVVRNKLLENRKIEAATHNIIAYRIRVPNSEVMFQNCEDDGEFGAGGRVLHLLQILNAENVMVIVTRWYGGIHLGPDRFKHINNLAREILQQHGYIKEKEDKKGPRSNKKK